MFASIDKDESLRKEHWNEIIGDRYIRMIMHDMSNLSIDQTELHRATFSQHYGRNCGKDGVFTQLCGWEGVIETFTGSVGDDDYVDKSKILEIQQKFAEGDPEFYGTVIPFLNVFDKGYQVLLDCYKHGGQLCWLPVFRKSDERYGRYST